MTESDKKQETPTEGEKTVQEKLSKLELEEKKVDQEEVKKETDDSAASQNSADTAAGASGDAASASDAEALISDTESVGEMSVDKTVSAASSDSEAPSAAAAASEEKKTDKEFSEAEMEKAEGFKNKGNEFFKSKSIFAKPRQFFSHTWLEPP